MVNMDVVVLCDDSRISRLYLLLPPAQWPSAYNALFLIGELLIEHFHQSAVLAWQNDFSCLCMHERCHGPSHGKLAGRVS